MSTLAHTWTPPLNSSPAPLCRSDVQPLGLGRENSAMATILRPWSWVLALLARFVGIAFDWTTKEAKGYEVPVTQDRPDVPQKQLGFPAIDLRKVNQTFSLTSFSFQIYLLLRTINSGYCFPCSQGPWVDRQSLMISEQIQAKKPWHWVCWVQTNDIYIHIQIWRENVFL